MMCVADQFVVICLDCIDDETERVNVVNTILESGKEIIEISENQMQQFARKYASSAKRRWQKVFGDE